MGLARRRSLRLAVAEISEACAGGTHGSTQPALGGLRTGLAHAQQVHSVPSRCPAGGGGHLMGI